MKGERLTKTLAHAGVASRRKAEDIIRAGRVRVNGETVTDPARNVDIGRDKVEVDGQALEQTKEKAAFLLYKPSGYVSTVNDPWGRPTVLSFFEGTNRRLYPVGRLDLDTEGLLLLTDDGDLAYLLTHPSREVEKTYECRIQGKPSEPTLATLRQGVELDDGVTSPARVRVISRRGNQTTLEIVIHEGRKRQVKRMCLAVGHRVLHLKRTRVAFLTLVGLKPGQYRQLTPVEVDRLKRLAEGKS